MKKISILCCAILFCVNIQLFAQDSFFDDDIMGGGGDGGGSSSFDFSGFVNMGIRMYPHKDIKRTEAVPIFGLNLKYNAERTELDSHFKCNARTIADYPLDLIDEFTIRAYLGDFVFSTGKMKLVWGRGDMLHVLDNFNANDFTDFTIPAYIDRRIAEPMVHVAYNAPIPLRLEAVWTPMMTPDRLALNGPWVPTQIEEMKKTVAKSFSNSDAFPYEQVQALLLSTIKDTLKTALSTPSVVHTTFPTLTDEEIEEIVNKFSTFEKTAARAILMAIRGRVIDLDISDVLTDEKIEQIAKTESEKYAKLFKEEFTKKLSDANKKIQQLDLSPFMKMGMNAFMPDMNQIQYGQYGLRLSGSAGPVDMACQYYFGHYKTPSFDTEGMINAAVNGGDIRSYVYYDPVHIFGVDLGAAVAMFNLRSEFAYYMTYDFKGNDPSVHNNSLQWVLGFDVDIPLNNINLNVQNLGSYILGFKNVKQNNTDGKSEMDWSNSEKSTNNKLVVNISDSWLHENLTDSVTVIWGIEHNDIVVMPKIKYKIKDEFYVEASGAYIYAQNEKSEFSAWKNNHFIQLSFEYHF